VCLYVCLYVSECICICQLLWHQRGILLERKLYKLVCTSLTDDYEGVRLAAVKLVCVFSLVYPEQSVTFYHLSLLHSILYLLNKLLLLFLFFRCILFNLSFLLIKHQLPSTVVVENFLVIVINYQYFFIFSVIHHMKPNHFLF